MSDRRSFSTFLVASAALSTACASVNPSTASPSEGPLEAVREFRSAVLAASSVGELALHVHSESEWKSELERMGNDDEGSVEWREFIRPYEPAEARIFGDSAVVVAYGAEARSLVFVLARDSDGWRVASAPAPELAPVRGASGSFELAGAIHATVREAHARVDEEAAWITIYDTFEQYLAGGFGEIRVPTLAIRYPTCPEVGTHEANLNLLAPDVDDDGNAESFGADPEGEAAVLVIRSVSGDRFSGTIRGTLRSVHAGVEGVVRVTGGLHGIPVRCPRA